MQQPLNPTPGNATLSDEMSTSVSDSQTPTVPVGFRFQFSLFLANVTLWLLSYPLSSILYPQQATYIDTLHKEVVLSIALTVSSLIGLGVVPIVGILSDRTRSRFGRRRPWLVLAAILFIVGLIILAHALSLVIFTLGVIVVGIAGGVASTALNAVIPDHVPEQQRGTVSGWVGLATPLSLIISALLVPKILVQTGGSLTLAYYLLIVPVVVILIPYALLLRDTPAPVVRERPLNGSETPRYSRIGGRLYANFGFVCLTRFLLILGFNLGTVYLLFYLRDVVHYEQLFPGQKAVQGVGTLQIVSVLGLVVATILGGIISDRIHNRKLVVMVSSVLIGIGLFTLAISHTWTAALVSSAFQGLGFGAYLAVDTALATLVLPHPENRARDLAFVTVSGNIGILIAPVVVAFFVTGLGLEKVQSYTLLFVIAGILSILAAILVQPIKGVR